MMQTDGWRLREVRVRKTRKYDDNYNPLVELLFTRITSVKKFQLKEVKGWLKALGMCIGDL